MSKPIFAGHVIALIWDFDQTLIPGYMQAPLLKRFGIAEGPFWTEVNSLPAVYRRQGVHRVNEDTVYLNSILDHVRSGRMPGLSNALLRELGQSIAFHPGVQEFLAASTEMVAQDPLCKKHGIVLEHCVVSAGLREMILGSAIAPLLKDIYGCEFTQRETPQGPEIDRVAYVIDNTTKTRAIFEINKGTNIDPKVGVNDAIDPELRRVPFQQMIYVADGPSDVPVFSLLQKNGGHTCAVYESGSKTAFEQANGLWKQKRVDMVGPADYRAGTQTRLWLEQTISLIAKKIDEDQQRVLAAAVHKTHRHREE